jgi:hypothetical protein
MSVSVLVAFDGDDLGQQIGRLSLADDEAGMRKLSTAIDQAGQVFGDWALACGGEIINRGGDEGRIRVGADHLDELPEVKQKYEDIAGTSCTVGIGTKLSQADTALLVGKLRGKDTIVFWSEDVEQELNQAREEYSQSQLDKLGDHYFEKSEYTYKEYILQKALRVPGKYRGAHAGYQAKAPPVRPAAPQKPKPEGSEHSAAEYLVHTIEQAAPGSPEATKAARQLEEYLHQIVDIEEASEAEMADAEEKAKRTDAMRQQVAAVLTKVKEQAPLLAQLKEVAPEAYQSIIDMTQSIIAMAKETLEGPGGEQELHKSEGEPKTWTADLVSHLVGPQKERARQEKSFVPRKDARLRMVSIDDLEPHRFSEEPDPEEHGDPEDFWHYSGLYDTFHKEVGPISEQISRSPETVHPIVVSGKEIVDGHRRVAAARGLGLTHVPALAQAARRRKLGKGEVIDFKTRRRLGSTGPIARMFDIDPKIESKLADIIGDEPVFYHKEKSDGLGSDMTLSGLFGMGKHVLLDKDTGNHIVTTDPQGVQMPNTRYLVLAPDGSYSHTDKSATGKLKDLPTVRLQKGDVVDISRFRDASKEDRSPMDTLADVTAFPVPKSTVQPEYDTSPPRPLPKPIATGGPGGKDTFDLTGELNIPGYQFFVEHTYGQDDDRAIGYLYHGEGPEQQLVGATQINTGGGHLGELPDMPQHDIPLWSTRNPHHDAWQGHLKALDDYVSLVRRHKQHRGDVPPLGKAEGLVFQEVPPETFEESIARHPRQGSLDQPRDYIGKTPYLAADGSSGYVLGEGGYMGNVFSHTPGHGAQAVRDAIARGASHANFFDNKKLAQYYKQFGFEEERREPNWTPGGPDVVHVRLGKSDDESDDTQDLEKAGMGVGRGRKQLKLPPGTAETGATKDAKTPRRVKTITSMGDAKERQIRTASGSVPSPTDPAEAGTMPRTPEQVSVHEIGSDPRARGGG